MSAPGGLVHASEARVGGFKEASRRFAHGALDPLVRGLVAAGFKADHFTYLGLALSALSAWAFYDGQMRVGAVVLIAAGLCDILDGQVARVGGHVSRYGAFLDSSLDRLADALVLLGLAGFYASNLVGLFVKSKVLVAQVAAGEIEPGIALLTMRGPVPAEAWLMLTLISVLALIGSFLVSYTRARAEGLGFECKVGFFERPWRVILLIVAGLVQVFWVMSLALILLTILSFATAAQRMLHVRRLANESSES